jgi:hypothetical protein
MGYSSDARWQCRGGWCATGCLCWSARYPPSRHSRFKALVPPTAFFLGGNPRLREPATVTGEDDRFELQTHSLGTVQVGFEVLFLGFDEAGLLTT